MTPLPLEVATASIRNQPVSAVVALPAEIDVYNREQAYSRIHSACASGASVVIADFTGTRFCDCACLNRLLRVYNQAAGHDAQLRLVISPGAPVREVVKLLGLDRQLPVYANIDAAQADLEQS